MSSSVSALAEATTAIPSDRNERKQQSKGFAVVIRRGLSEPLVHFLLIGIGLFVVYSLFSPSSVKPSSSGIELTSEDLNQLQVTWMAQWQRPPTADEMRGLIDTKVRQEILYREALTLGLEQGDEIVKRRLAQKMEFLAEDVSAIREPTREELNAWFYKNSVSFALPGRITFRHLYFSPDKRGQQAQDDAAQVLQKLAAEPVAKSRNHDSESSLTDRFMDLNYYADCTPEQVSKIFGAKFSESLFKLKVGSWLGPLESGLGWHLVWIDSITPGRVPAFEEVDPAQIKSEWMTDQRAEAKRQSFEVMRQRYEIVLPPAQ